MTTNVDVQSASEQIPEEIKEKVEGASGEIKERRRYKEKVRSAAKQAAGRVRGMKGFTSSKEVLGSSLAMSGARIAILLIASAMRRRNPLESFSTMSEQLPFVRTRKRAYRPSLVLGGVGSIIAGSMVLALLNRTLGRRVSDRAVMRGAMATLGAIGMDALVMGPRYIADLVRNIGPAATALKYGAIGGAYSMASRRRPEVSEGIEAISPEAEMAAPEERLQPIV
jgi:hypothetical protein